MAAVMHEVGPGLGQDPTSRGMDGWRHHGEGGWPADDDEVVLWSTTSREVNSSWMCARGAPMEGGCDICVTSSTGLYYMCVCKVEDQGA